VIAHAVEVTGLGVVSSGGLSVREFGHTIFSGKCTIGDISDRAHSLRYSVGAPIRSFDPQQYFDEKTLGTLDRFTQFAAVAAREALTQAGLPDSKASPERIGVIVGTANAGIDILSEGYMRIKEGKKPRPLTVPMTMASAPASRIAHEVKARGPVFGVSSACASAGHAILVGLMLIRSGTIDVAIVGGTDSCFCEGYLMAWDGLRVVAADTCRPFSIDRQGLVIGEGAAILVLERADHAALRGARPLAKLIGAAMTSDAGDLIAPDPRGMGQAMLRAITDGRIAASAVDYINAHGTGTIANDRAEATAIKELFGSRAKPIAVSSTKSMIGHTMGAAGALEATATILAIRNGIIPPTVNYRGLDPECDIDVTPNVARNERITVALSNSFAFGGLNVCLAFAAPTV
jgi:nodulation protein E